MAALAEQINSIGRQLFVMPQLSDDSLAQFYLDLKKQGLFRWVYYMKEPTLTEFLAFHRRTDLVYLGGMTSKILDNGTMGEPELAGIGWLESIQRMPGLSKGQVGMAFLRKYQRDDTALELARMFIDYAFDKVGVDVVLGTTPVRNRAAVLFSRKLRFREIGVGTRYVSFWGTACDAVLTEMTKDCWRGGY